MKIINKIFMVLIVSLIALTLFAQSGSSTGYQRLGTEIDTFLKRVDSAGRWIATAQTADGGFITTSKIDDTNFLVMKIKASGQKQWEKTLNFQVRSDTQLYPIIAGIAQTTDGGFVLAGGGCSDPYFCTGL